MQQAEGTVPLNVGQQYRNSLHALLSPVALPVAARQRRGDPVAPRQMEQNTNMHHGTAAVIPPRLHHRFTPWTIHKSLMPSRERSSVSAPNAVLFVG